MAKIGQSIGNVLGWVMVKIASLFAWLLGAAALLLDVVVYYTVVKMGDFFTNVANIGVVWRVLRDISNIALIFGFVFAGISVIIGHELYGYGKKMLPMLLVAALFINFSLFIAGAVIDVGNIFATQIFAQINGGNVPGPAQFESDSPVVNEGISNRIMSVLGLQSIYHPTDATENAIASSVKNDFMIGFMSIILFLVAAFVFFSLAFVLVARFVVLIIVLILSPLGFAGLIIPKLQGVARRWWSTLAEQTLTAPVLLLLLYIALAVITDVNFLVNLGVEEGGNTANNAANAWKGVFEGKYTQFAGVLLSFVIAMALLLAVLYVAKQMSAIGGTWATRMGGRLSFGLVAWGGRMTAGTAGNLLASKRMMGWATPKENEGRSRRIARYLTFRPLTWAGKGLRAGAYDVRNVPGAGGALGLFGVDAGKGAKLTAKDMYTAGYGWKPTQKYFQESAAEYRAAGKERDYRVAQREIEAAKADLAAGRITQDEYDRRVAPHEKVISDNLAKLSTKQLEELTGIKQGVEALVHNLSPQQFDALLKSDKLTGAQKNNIITARYSALSDAVATGTDADVQKQLRGMGKIDLENLSDALRTDLVVRNLTANQFETVMKSEKYADTEKARLSGLRFKAVIDAVEKAETTRAAADIDAARTELGKITTKEMPHLGDTFISKDFVADNLSNDQYEALTKEGVITTAMKTAIDARRKDRFDPTKRTPADVADAIRFLKWNREAINKLPPDTITNEDVLNELGDDALTLIDMARRANLASPQRKKLGEYFEKVRTNPADSRNADFIAYLGTNPQVKRDLLIP